MNPAVFTPSLGDSTGIENPRTSPLHARLRKTSQETCADRKTSQKKMDPLRVSCAGVVEKPEIKDVAPNTFAIRVSWPSVIFLVGAGGGIRTHEPLPLRGGAFHFRFLTKFLTLTTHRQAKRVLVGTSEDGIMKPQAESAVSSTFSTFFRVMVWPLSRTIHPRLNPMPKTAAHRRKRVVREMSGTCHLHPLYCESTEAYSCGCSWRICIFETIVPVLERAEGL